MKNFALYALLCASLASNLYCSEKADVASIKTPARPYGYAAAMTCASALAIYGGLKTDNYALAGAGLGIAAGTAAGLFRDRLNKWLMPVATPLALLAASRIISNTLDDIHEDDITGYARNSVIRRANNICANNPDMSRAASIHEARREYAFAIMTGAAITSSIAAYYATKYMTPEIVKEN